MAKTSKATKKAPAKKAVVKSATKKAAAPKAAKAKAATPVANRTDFDIVMGVEKPARSRSGVSRYPFASLPVDGSFLVAAEVVDPALYTSETEATKAQSDALALVANRMSGAVRRFTKGSNTDAKFTVFGIRNGKESGFKHDIGVVVKRIK